VITITCMSRENQKKGDVKRLRREGQIPCVVYSKGKAAESCSVLKTDIEAAMRNMQAGFLPTTVFCLKTNDGRERQVLAREVQYAPTTYAIMHMDFMEMSENVPVYVKVPVELTNVVDCVGVKLGGFLQTIMRHVKVRCLPKKIPSHFEVDVKELDIFGTKRVKDLVVATDVKCLENKENVVVTVSKKI
jgi:large subunit ribosomal protein L25